jgi:O-antigen ligase
MTRIIAVARNSVFYVAVLFLSYLIAKIIPDNARELTLGALGRFFFGAVFAACMLLLVRHLRMDHLKNLTALPGMRWGGLLLVAPAAFVISFFFVNVFKLSPLISLVSIFVVGSAVWSVYLVLDRRLFQSLLVFIFSLPFLRMLEWEVARSRFEWVIAGPVVVTPTILFLLCIFFSYLLGKKDDKYIELSALPLSALIFFLALLVSVIVSSDIFHSSKLFLVEMFYPLLFFYLLLKGLRSADQVKTLLYVLIVAGIVYALFGFYSIVGMSLPTFDKLYLLYGEEGMAGAFRIMGTLALSTSGKKRACLVAAACFELLLVLASFSRVALLAAGLSLLPFLKKKEILLMLAFAVALIFMFHGWFMDNIFIRFNVFDSLQKLDMFYWSPMRLWAARGAVAMIRDHPFFGIGYGMWPAYYYKYGPAINLGTGYYYITSAHNAFFDMTAQGGFLLLAAVLAFLAACFKECFSLVFLRGKMFVSNIALACLGFFISAVVVSFAGNIFAFSYQNDITRGLFFWSMAAVLAALGKIARAEKEGLKEAV